MLTGITAAASLVSILVTLTLLLAVRLVNRKRLPKGLRLPPGPPGRWILGNLTDMPTQHEWETYAEWAKKYGGLVHIKIFGQSIVIIDTADIAYELFEKRSAIYSDRTELPMLKDLMGFTWFTAFMHYGQEWRRNRALMHKKLHPAAAAEYHPIQAKHIRRMLRRLCESPDDFVNHIRHSSGAITMELVYAINVLDKDDPYIEAAEKAMSHFGAAANPGTFLVDVLPILKYVPEWFPGAGFRKTARLWRQDIIKMNVIPFEATKKALNAGTANPSFTSSLLEDLTTNGTARADEEAIIRGVGSTLYAGGSDAVALLLASRTLQHTDHVIVQIVHTLHTFILAMVISPEVQKKAQAELDAVMGPNRLPEFEDRNNLPYINALCKEVLRWHPLEPLGFAHATTQDDIYDGYFIPKGAIILGNSWQILHDEAVYGPNTDDFNPERFLDPNVKYPNAAFGYGRRICPGRHLADNSVFIAVASILKVFDITPARDSSTGEEIPVSKAFTSGFFSYPEPFVCSIRPRSDASEALIVQGEV
ncbi:cytochrome P450 [Gautieria morchelliformis]|nr:cytochrome P450 [Gautieria morchelliformis]